MPSRRLCAAALIVTAVIHLAVVPEHAREWVAAAAFFVVLSAAEVVLAVAVLTRTSRRLLVAGSVISVMSAALWAASRTLGLPIGPEAFSAEAVAAPDLIATALEVLAAAIFARLALRATVVSVPARVYQ
jgi:hypothetical protein